MLLSDNAALLTLLGRLEAGGTCRGHGSETWPDAKRWGLVRRDRNGNSRLTRRGAKLLADSTHRFCGHCDRPPVLK